MKADDPKFWAKVSGGSVEECWEWTAYRGIGGYGTYRGRPAHRISYEMLRADIPTGLYIDHLCCNRACVNPWHLEPVSARTNSLRSVHRGGTNIPCMDPNDQPDHYRYSLPQFARRVKIVREWILQGLITDVTPQFLRATCHMRGNEATAAMSWLAHWGLVDSSWKRTNVPRIPRGVLQPVAESLTSRT